MAQAGYRAQGGRTLSQTIWGSAASTLQVPQTSLPPHALRFRDCRVIVTGASSGIGRAVALRFLQAGATVVLLGRDSRRLDEVARAPTNAGVAYPMVVDLTDPVDTEAVFREAMSQLKRLDVLVNAAGTLRGRRLDQTSMEEWDKCMGLNVRTVTMLSSMAVPFLTLSKGCIVNVSSTAGQKAMPGAAAYSIAKACVDMLTKCSAIELSVRGVRVNAVAPGVTDTDARMSPDADGLTRSQNRTFMSEAATRAPLVAVATVWDIADSVLFLASPDASFITGTILNVDGGQSITSSGWELYRQDQMSALDKLGSKASRFFRWTHFKDV